MPRKTRRASRKSGGFFGLFDILFGEKKNEQVATPVSEAPANSSIVAMGGKRKSKSRKAQRKSRKNKSRKAGRR
jgi:hypothetical protein